MSRSSSVEGINHADYGIYQLKQLYAQVVLTFNWRSRAHTGRLLGPVYWDASTILLVPCQWHIWSVGRNDCIWPERSWCSLGLDDVAGDHRASPFAQDSKTELSKPPWQFVRFRLHLRRYPPAGKHLEFRGGRNWNLLHHLLLFSNIGPPRSGAIYERSKLQKWHGLRPLILWSNVDLCVS